MASFREYLSEIGRRGGTRSRRVLDAETARRMVSIREARRAARTTARIPSTSTAEPGGDTSAQARAVQDVLLRRMSAAQKLALVGSLSRTVDTLAREGVKARHPDADSSEIAWRMAVLKLGDALACRAYGLSPDAG